MHEPKPRETSIFPSKTIKELFYEGFKKNDMEVLNSGDLIIAVHYKGERFDLHESVEIVTDPDLGCCDFKKMEGQPLLGFIVDIEPENERDDQRILLVHDSESSKKDLFMITEIKKLSKE